MTDDVSKTSVELDHGLRVRFHGDLAVSFIQRWTQFASSGEKRSFLHLPEWYAAYLKSYFKKKDNAARALFAEFLQKDSIVAIIPFVQEKKRIGMVSADHLELMWPTDLGVRDCVLSDHADVESLSVWLVQALEDAGIQWDLIRFPDIVESSAAHRLINLQSNRQTLLRHHHYTARIPAEGDDDTCLAFLSSRMRKRLKTYHKQLSQKGEPQFQLVKADEIDEKWYDLFLEVESSGWKGEDGSCTALRFDDNQRRFYRSLFLSGSDACRIAILWVNGQAVAAKLCLECGDTLNMLKIGYDKAFAKEYPGMILLRHLIQRYASHPRIRYIAFVTDPEWAQRWRPERLEVHEATIYNNSMTGKLIYRLDMAKERGRQIKSKLKAVGANS